MEDCIFFNFEFFLLIGAFFYFPQAILISSVQFVAFPVFFETEAAPPRPIIYNRIIGHEINGMHLSFQSQMTCV